MKFEQSLDLDDQPMFEVVAESCAFNEDAAKTESVENLSRTIA
jgi:hypothetical protein